MKIRPARKVSKKGAIEMSMNTIIIVVIGITLLTLGLKFVYDIFADIGDTTGSLGELSDTEINKIFGQSTDAISLTSSSTTIEQGETKYASVRIRNLASTSTKLTYTVDVQDHPAEIEKSKVETWLGKPLESEQKSGKGFLDELKIAVPASAAPLGDYKLVFQVKCSAEGCGDGDIAILTFKVVPS